ncbi:MAG: sulfatase [Verrucomicrobiales bacterium]|nr:sulfatase [Verrucomicrobiales bacterium]
MQKLCFIVVSLGLWCRAAGAESQPNVLLAFADDLGRYASAYAVAGSVNEVIQTPNLDRVAREGALFQRAYVSAPSCTPSRAALLTGRHFFRNGSHSQLHHPWNGDKVIDPWNEAKGFGLMLQEAGYHIGWTYKMHLSEDRMGGKNRNYQQAGKRFNSFSENVTKAKSVEGGKRELLEEVRGNFRAFLADRKEGQPFFYWFNPTNTHRPWQRGSGKALWGIEPDSLKGRLPSFLPDEPEIREDFADYLGEALAFDAAVGVLLEELEARGELDNTVFAVSGDHGAPGFPRGKTNLYDFGTEVPLMMRWPDHIVPGRNVRVPVSLLDLAPTLLAAAGLEKSADMNGENLLPALNQGGSDASLRGWIITGRETHVNTAREGNLPYPQRAIRDGDFLYILNFKPDRWPVATPPLNTADTESRRMDIDFGPTRSWFVSREGDAAIAEMWNLGFGQRPEEELYDVSADADQVHNLAGMTAYEEKRRALREKLMAELKANHDPRVIDDAFDRPPYTDPGKKGK